MLFRSASIKTASLRHVSRYEKGKSVPLSELPEKFQEMNENPPESVVKVREKMVDSKKANRRTPQLLDLSEFKRALGRR